MPFDLLIDYELGSPADKNVDDHYVRTADRLVSYTDMPIFSDDKTDVRMGVSGRLDVKRNKLLYDSVIFKFCDKDADNNPNSDIRFISIETIQLD